MTKPEWKRFVDNGELLRTNISARWPGWEELNQINLAEFYKKLGFKIQVSYMVTDVGPTLLEIIILGDQFEMFVINLMHLIVINTMIFSPIKIELSP